MRKHHHKLFYGKHTHKASFILSESVFVWPTTNENLNRIINAKKLSNTKGFIAGKFVCPGPKELPSIQALANLILKTRKFVKFRIQSNCVMIFYGSERIIKKIIEKYWKQWINIETVDPTYIKQLGKNKRLCTRLPHNKYQYQVWLKKTAYDTNENFRKGLASYLLDKPEVARLSNKHLKWWVQGVSDYMGDGYFYIRDEKCLTPIYMILGKHIEKIIQFVKVDKNARINTKTHQ